MDEIEATGRLLGVAELWDMVARAAVLCAAREILSEAPPEIAVGDVQHLIHWGQRALEASEALRRVARAASHGDPEALAFAEQSGFAPDASAVVRAVDRLHHIDVRPRMEPLTGLPTREILAHVEEALRQRTH